MTFKSLLNLAGAGKSSYPSIDRYHSGHGGGYHHSSHGSYKSKGGSGGSGAALSALTLLAFLFLINVMQQSLQDNNSTMVPTPTTVYLRDGETPVVIDARAETEGKKKKEEFLGDNYGSPPKSNKGYVKMNK